MFTETKEFTDRLRGLFCCGRVEMFTAVELAYIKSEFSKFRPFNYEVAYDGDYKQAIRVIN